MLRTTLQKAYLKRTIRPLYGWTQATPKSCFLDPDFTDGSGDIFPGMAMSHLDGEVYTLYDGTRGSGQPDGLMGLYVGGDGINEVEEQGINAIAVWVMATDAEFEVLAPAFDPALAWDSAGGNFVHARNADGVLVPDGTAASSADPVGRLIDVVSDTKIVVGGLRV